MSQSTHTRWSRWAAVASLWLGLQLPASAEEVVRVELSRYRFEPERIELPLGERVRLLLTSTDVDHGFAVPELGLSVRVPAGAEAVVVELTPDRVGTFEVSCSEFCGSGHAQMRGAIVVHGDGSAGEGEPATAVVEADRNVINVPTTLALERGGFAFRVTHRFARPLGAGDFGSLLEDFFGLDGGAQIGLELAYAPFDANQLGVYRTSDRTISLYDRHRWVDPSDGVVGLSLEVGVEGRNNFRVDYSPTVAMIVSRRAASWLDVYAVPRLVWNARLDDASSTPAADEDGRHTAVLGLGVRALLTTSVALVAEASPRLAGFDGRRGEGSNDLHLSFGIEKLVGGHAFQLNFSNDLGTTPAQVARGQQGADDWFIGFNISRRF